MAYHFETNQFQSTAGMCIYTNGWYLKYIKIYTVASLCQWKRGVRLALGFPLPLIPSNTSSCPDIGLPASILGTIRW